MGIWGLGSSTACRDKYDLEPSTGTYVVIARLLRVMMITTMTARAVVGMNDTLDAGDDKCR